MTCYVMTPVLYRGGGITYRRGGGGRGVSITKDFIFNNYTLLFFMGEIQNISTKSIALHSELLKSLNWSKAHELNLQISPKVLYK